MNKKQAVIILTLLALIVCAGVYAAKINSGNNQYVNGEDPNKISSINTNDSKKTVATFDETKIKRELDSADSLARLEKVMNDKNSPAETKADATTKFKELSLAIQYSKEIETNLKLKGFEDSVCSISDSKVNLTIKSKEAKLTEKQMRDIEYVVMSTSKLKNIQYEIKQ